MKIAGVELKDAGRKSDETKAVEGKSLAEAPKIQYPSMCCETNSHGWNLPIDLSDFNAGDKAVLVAVVNVKEKTKRESESERDGKESGVTGELEFLQVGIRKHADGKNKMSEDEVSKNLKDAFEESSEEES